MTERGKDVLKARAAHGYAWLQETGPLYGLDASRLHLVKKT